MPLHTYAYSCGCRRYLQGRECDCVLNELLRINDPYAFRPDQVGYLPFNTPVPHRRRLTQTVSAPPLRRNGYHPSTQHRPHYIMSPPTTTRSFRNSPPFASRSRPSNSNDCRPPDYGEIRSFYNNPYASCGTHDRSYCLHYNCPEHLARQSFSQPYLSTRSEGRAVRQREQRRW